jgi:hypothetical protein
MIDEIDFIERESGPPAFMFVRASDNGDVSIEIDIVQNGDLSFLVSLEDARRLGERLMSAGDLIETGQ